MIIFLYSIAISLMILLPVVAAVVWRRRYSVRWGLFGVGMLTFVGSQVYHLPLNNWLSDLGLIGDIGPDAPGLLATALVLGFSARLPGRLATGCCSVGAGQKNGPMASWSVWGTVGLKRWFWVG